jgi:D-alanyl-D-alanine carboxypeptidase/D-alanyl-D-alanine-endopeptidase (penicillin-binding protein 4)
VLQAGLTHPGFGRAFVSSLPVAGVSGTLKNRLGTPPTLRRVIAKTGTTSRSCALAGFVGRRYAFAILQNGAPLSFWYARAAQDRFVTVLARSQ